MLPDRKIENTFLWGIKALVFLIPFLPLYISTSMVFPYVAGKNFAFRILVELATVLWIGLITAKKKYMPHSSGIFLSILIFTFIVGVADLSGVNPYRSFWSNYERMEGYITILHLTLYFMIIRSVLQTRKDWLLFFNIILAVSLLVCLFSLNLPAAVKGTPLWMEYGKRIYGTVGNPPFLAAYSLLAIFIGFIAFIHTEKKYLKACYILVIILNAVVIYLTATRGAILAGLAGLMTLSAFFVSAKGKRQKWKLKNAGMTIAVICSVAVAVITITSHKNYSFKQDITLSRLASMSSDNSVKARIDSWKMSWNGFKERPLLGWGQENFLGIYTVNPIPFKGVQIWADRAHNIVIEWLINAGILGLLSYMAILGSALYVVREKYRRKLLSGKETVIIVTALCVYFLQNLFTFDTINTYFLFFSLLAYIDVIGTEKDNKDPAPREAAVAGGTMMRSFGLTLLASMIFIVIFYFANYRPMEESRRCLQIIKSVSVKRSFSALLKDFKDVLALHTFGDSDVRASMENISNFIITTELFYAEGAPEFLKETVMEMERGIPENYYNLEYLANVIRLYNKIAFYDPAFGSRAESLIKWCMNINPSFEGLHFALADTYRHKKEYAKMFEIVNNMASLDPYNDQKQLKLALAAIHMEKREVAREALRKIQQIRGGNEVDAASGTAGVFERDELTSIAEAYLSINDYQQAIDYLKQAIDMAPNRAVSHFTLANVYLSIGDKTLALAELEKAARLNPLRYGEISGDAMDSLNKLNK